MSKCVYCRQRKGKRACPALGGTICSLCCGEHRLSRIACPSDCPFLDQSSEYQEKRVGEQFALARRDFYRAELESGGEKAAALFNLLEVVSFGYFHGRRDGQDAELVAAVQAFRRSLSPLHVPAGPGQTLLAERLKTEYEAFVKQQPDQIADASAATETCDRAVKFISEFSGKDFQSRRFLTGLLGYIKTHHPEVADHLSKRQEGGRIVLPGQFSALSPPRPARMPSGSPHIHGPGCEHQHH